MSDEIPEAVTDPDRLRALAETGLVGAPAEDAFDRFTRLARQLLGVPTSLLTLVDPNHQFFLSAEGFDVEPWASGRGTPLSHSFCKNVVAYGDFVVDDARQDPRTTGHPAVDELGVVAYAGVPVVGPDGQQLGALCAIDGAPRTWSESDLENLRDLAAAAGSEIALRVVAERQRRHAATTARQVRAPLTALRIQLADVAERLAADTELRDDVVSTAEQLTKLSDNVVELMNAASSSRFGFEEKVEVNQVLREVAAEWAPMDGDPLVTVEDNGDGLPIVVPAGALRQVIDQLVGVTVGHARGPITLSAAIEEATVRINVRHEAGPLPEAFRTELLHQHDHVSGDWAPGDPSDDTTAETPAEVVARRIGGRLAVTPDGLQLILASTPPD